MGGFQIGSILIFCFELIRRGPQRLFTKEEQQKMIDWVCRRGDHDRIMSQDLYKEMERAKVPYLTT